MPKDKHHTCQKAQHPNTTHSTHSCILYIPHCYEYVTLYIYILQIWRKKEAAFSSDTHKDIVHHSHIDAHHIPTNRGHINIINVQRHYLWSVYTPGHNYHTDQNATGTCSTYWHAHTKNTYSHINTHAHSHNQDKHHPLGKTVSNRTT